MRLQQSLTLSSLRQTESLGKQIAQHLFPGAILLLSGDLGSGKTTLSKSICEGIGIAPNLVISPTYTIVNIYPGKWEVFHVDLYRLQEESSLDDFDEEDLLCEEGITLIEWPKPILTFLDKKEPLYLSFYQSSNTERTVTLKSDNPKFESLIQAVKLRTTK